MIREGPALTDGGVPAGGTRPGSLPPPDAMPFRLLGLSGALVQRYHRDTVRALVETVAPDAVVATPLAPGSVAPSLDRSIPQPVLTPGRAVRPTSVTSDGGTVLSLGSDDTPQTLREVTATDGETRSPDCVLSDELSLSVDPHERTTTLEGVSDYRGRLPDEWTQDGTAHVSTALRPGFRRTMESANGTTMTIVGIGSSEAHLGVGVEDESAEAAVVAVYPNGAVNTRGMDPTSVGLRSVTDVGPTRASALRDAGYSTVQQLSDARAAELADLPGIGRSTASTIHLAARARVEGAVIPTGDGAVPHGEPVFIDIETDGLEPSTAWLIGVLDGDADDGHFLPFREQQPGDAAHLDAFMTWLTGSAAGRPVVAWNGYGFDFPVIADQLRQHCPEHLDAWHDTYQWDPLYWARDQGNTALPGRSNSLEPVAEALGWEPTTQGIDGRTVARVYGAWRERVRAADDPAGVPEPDWERLEAYCEDDVRALATIHDALADAAKRDPSTTSTAGSDSRQGALSDFS